MEYWAAWEESGRAAGLDTSFLEVSETLGPERLYILLAKPLVPCNGAVLRRHLFCQL